MIKLTDRITCHRVRVALMATTAGWFFAPALAQTVPADPAQPASAEQAVADAAADRTATATAPAPSAPAEPGEIIVTALRRDTRLQETPIAISAISADRLANSGVQNIADLSSSVPSLNIVDGGGSFRRVVIRGIQSAGEPTVGVYYDDVPVTGVPGAGADAGGNSPEIRLFDIDRVEVLRGPQGTLYGAGSMGGTLRVIFKKPTAKRFEGAVDASLSDTAHGGMGYELQGMVNAPLVDDVLAVRAVAFTRQTAGYIDNVYLGIKDINRFRSYGGRLMLRFTPAPNFTLDLAGFYNKSSGDTPSWDREAGEYASRLFVRTPTVDKVRMLTGTARWDVGPVTLTATAARTRRNTEDYSDQTQFLRNFYTPTNCARILKVATCDTAQMAQYRDYVYGYTPGALHPVQDMRATTAELRASSNGSGPLQWTVGGFYMKRQTSIDNSLVRMAANGDPIEPFQPLYIRLIDDGLRQVAAFAEVSWDVSPQLNITAGTRYFKYKKTVAGEVARGLDLIRTVVTPVQVKRATEDGFVVKLNTSYKFTPDIMVYAEASQGFRPGGVNQVIGLPETAAPYTSDRLWNYELGLKTAWFNKRMTFNIDVFQIDWKDMQISAQTIDRAFSFITNAGKSGITGVEGELWGRIARGLEVNANATWMTAKLTTNQANAAVSAPGLRGDRIPYIPRFTAGAGVQYRTPIAANLNLFARADYSLGGGFYSELRAVPSNTRYTPSYNLVNARIGVEAPGDRWGAYLFVTNLFDSTAIVRTSSYSTSRFVTPVVSAAPRTIGVNLRARF